jgi:hypothetical protein
LYAIAKPYSPARLKSKQASFLSTNIFDNAPQKVSFGVFGGYFDGVGAVGYGIAQVAQFAITHATFVICRLAKKTATILDKKKINGIRSEKYGKMVSNIVFQILEKTLLIKKMFFLPIFQKG